MARMMCRFGRPPLCLTLCIAVANGPQFFSCPEIELFLDPFEIGITVRDDLIGDQLRRYLAGSAWQVLWRAWSPSSSRSLTSSSFGSVWCLLGRRSTVCGGERPGHPDDHPDHSADRTTVHNADRSGRLVALASALLASLNRPCASTCRGSLTHKARTSVAPVATHRRRPVRRAVRRMCISKISISN